MEGGEGGKYEETFFVFLALMSLQRRPAELGYAEARNVYDSFVYSVSLLVPDKAILPEEQRHILDPLQVQKELDAFRDRRLVLAGKNQAEVATIQAAYSQSLLELQAVYRMTHAGMYAISVEHGCTVADLYEEINRRAFSPHSIYSTCSRK
jgi:hypothetical protein